MPTYEFRCRTCGSTFELSRPMAHADQTAVCPAGHTDTVKLLAAISLGGRASASSAPMPAPSGGGGGCCGGACGCG